MSFDGITPFFPKAGPCRGSAHLSGGAIIFGARRVSLRKKILCVVHGYMECEDIVRCE